MSTDSTSTRAPSGGLAFVEDDGGRSEAGYIGTTGDCATRALAIISGRPYKECYDLINAYAKTERRSSGKSGRSNARTGVHSATMRRLIEREFPSVTWTPTMTIGSGTTVHLREGELPAGRLLVRVSKHYCAVVDGVVRDNHDPSRDGTRAVYGYWTFPEEST